MLAVFCALYLLGAAIPVLVRKTLSRLQPQFLLPIRSQHDHRSCDAPYFYFM